MKSPFPPGLDELRTLCAPVFESFPAVRRVYVFGSVAEGNAGPASDVDFGIVCAPGADRPSYFNLGFDLASRLSSLLSSDRIDVVVLNASESSELRHAVIQDGTIIYDRGDDLEAFERQIRHEYQDHRGTLARLGIR
jgi:predicted nucleotidyltransferase